MTCRYADDCKMFAYIRETHVRESILERYCEGPEQPQCARFKLQVAGKIVPLDLLPDGNAIED